MWSVAGATVAGMTCLFFYWRKVDRNLDDFYFDGDPQAIEFLERNYPRLKNNKRFMLRYAKIYHAGPAGEKKAEIMAQAARLVPSSILYGDTGLAFQEIGRNDEAEYYFTDAHWMVPGYVDPLYRLFRLYKSTGETDKAMEIAKEISTLTIKHHTPKSIEIRTETNAYIEENP